MQIILIITGAFDSLHSQATTVVLVDTVIIKVTVTTTLPPTVQIPTADTGVTTAGTGVTTTTTPRRRTAVAT